MNTSTIVFFMLILSAFFSGMEIAFVTSNKLKIELDKKRNILYAKIFSFFIKIPSRFIGAMLVGNNIALVIYGIATAKILEPIILHHLPEALSSNIIVIILQTILSTFLILIFAEFLPKVIFRINPNLMIRIFSIPSIILYILLYPINFVLTGVSEYLIGRIFKIKFSKIKHEFGKVDLEHYIKEFVNNNDNENEVEHEVQIFQNALDFSKVRLRECMIPRNEIIAIENTDSIENLKNKFISSGLSKILIYKDSIDNIIGYTHSYSMFKKPKNISSITKPIIIVPETMFANNVLTMFIQQKKSVAVVVDEFGGTSGMLTMEDVIEEIFGEIKDEYDEDELIEKQINENEFIFSGRLEIDYINEKYNLDLPKDDDYETLTGLIFKNYERIPQINEEIFIDGFNFKVLKVTNTRLDQIRLKVI